MKDSFNKAKTAVDKAKTAVEKVKKLRTGEDAVNDLADPVEEPVMNSNIAETSFGANFGLAEPEIASAVSESQVVNPAIFDGEGNLTFEPGTSTYLSNVPTQEQAIQASRALQATQARPTNDDLPKGSGEVDNVVSENVAENVVPHEPIDMAPQEEVQNIASQVDEGSIASSLSSAVEGSTSGIISDVAPVIAPLIDGGVEGALASLSLPGIGEIAAPLLLISSLIGSIVSAATPPEDQTPAPSLQLDV